MLCAVRAYDGMYFACVDDINISFDSMSSESAWQHFFAMKRIIKQYL